MVENEVEREIKLDAPPDGTALPDLSGLPGVAEVRPESQSMEAWYFDTEDLALATARTTLRRRTGGSDAGWHLKRPLDDGARTETRVPLGRAVRTVPAALRSQVRALTRDRPLVRVATVANERVVHALLDADGTVLAEVCDDRVQGTALVGSGDGERSQTWREWEVELKAGDPALLEAAVPLLVGAGAAPASSASKLQRVLGDGAVGGGPPKRGGLRRSQAGAVVWTYLAGQVSALTTQDARVRTDEPDSVHAMRVATRRLRSALKTFRPLLDRTVTDPLRTDLKELGNLLGEARDAEVMRERLRDSITGLEPELVVGPVERRMALELDQRYRQAHQDVVAHLDGDRYLRLLDGLDELLAAPPWTSKARKKSHAALLRRTRSAYRDVAAGVDHAAGLAPGAERDAALHECRKAAKRARYAGEALTPAIGRPAERFAQAMKAVQDALGEHQDSVVARGLVRDVGVRAHLAGENAFTWGLLHGVERAAAREAHVAYDEAWQAASRPKLRRWLSD